MSVKRLHLLAAAVAAGALAGAAQAAPITYQNAVLADNPYLYYRLGETNDPLTNVPAADQSANHISGVYRGTPTGGVAGAGTGSDTAVSFPGGTGLNYLRTGTDATTNDRAFGSLVGQSSYEFVFKANTPGLTGYQSLFGVFNAPDTTVTPNRTNAGAVAVELNSNATGNLNNGTSRLYVRDEDGIALGGTIDNGTLLDGNYHDLIMTYNVAGGADSYMHAYVDGVEVPVTHVYQGGGNSTNVPDNLLPFTVDPVYGARNVRGTVGNFANVTLDEAVLYPSVLGAAQAATHAAAVGVPEPTSVALFAAAGLGLAARRRRMR